MIITPPSGGGQNSAYISTCSTFRLEDETGRFLGLGGAQVSLPRKNPGFPGCAKAWHEGGGMKRRGRKVPSTGATGGSARLSRRQFGWMALAAPIALPGEGCSSSLPQAGGLTDLEGLQVGHFTSQKRPTGCTVVLAPQGAVAGVDVRGSSPGTRETDLLDPINTVQKVHAILLSGGSAFGLDAAAGVVQYLEEKKIGFETSRAKVPIVPAAVLYDLSLGDPKIRPGRSDGYLACLKAGPGPVAEGNVGAGSGATVGRMLGGQGAMKGGLGSFALRVGDLIVAGLAAVNCAGDVYEPRSSRILAGARSPDGKSFTNLAETLKTRPPAAAQGQSTTLVVVATNAAFDKSGMTKIAQMSHDGMARVINPAHTPYDGDTVFAISTGGLPNLNLAQVGALAAEVTSEAIVRGVKTASSLLHYPAYCDLEAAQ